MKRAVFVAIALGACHTTTPSTAASHGQGAPPTPSTAAAPPASPPDASSDVDDLLSRGHGDKFPEYYGDDHRLSARQIDAAMTPVKMRVSDCFEKYRVPGYAVVSFTIRPSGRVIAVTISGKLESTPTGACIREAGKRAMFPRFEGDVFKLNYPFMLSR